MTHELLMTLEQKVANLHHRLMGMKDPNVSWIETVSDYATEQNTDVEELVPLLSPYILARIKDEAREKRLVRMPKGAKRVSIDID